MIGPPPVDWTEPVPLRIQGSGLDPFTEQTVICWILLKGSPEADGRRHDEDEAGCYMVLSSRESLVPVAGAFRLVANKPQQQWLIEHTSVQEV